MIKNKEQSREFIKNAKLNTVWTSELLKGDLDNLMILSYVDPKVIKHYDYYGIRENKPGGLFQYAVSRDNLLFTIVENYANKYFTVCESMYFKDKENMLVQGDFYLTENFILSYGYSDIKGKSLRESSRNFPYKIWELDIKQRHYLNSNINKIVDYLVNNNLFNMTVELTLYDYKVGIKNENIIIWEVRNY